LQAGKAAEIIQLTWAQRLKRAFEFDVTVCPLCGGALYRSLDPDDVGQVVGYTYEVEEKVAVRGLLHVLCA
jgi:hypothetical protein